MDVILKVLEGAKVGTKIAIKKDEFLIGRSPKCHLCAGSSSVSRRHCKFTRKETSVTVQDMGSRNGTLVNGKKIAEEIELSTGDEIAVGSLKFLITITPGISNLKRPKVKTVADAIERTAATGDSSVAEDDITQWLHDAPGPTPQAATETQTIRMDDTKAVQLKKDLEESASEAASTAEKSDTSEAPHEEIEADDAQDAKKKKPGKLPPMPVEPSSKDSREAAMEALRNWNRRR